MRQGCKIYEFADNKTAIVCGGEPDHQCNDDATVYETFDGIQQFFEKEENRVEWYEFHYKEVRSMSVACSICHRAAIDNAMWLDI